VVQILLFFYQLRVFIKIFIFLHTTSVNMAWNVMWNWMEKRLKLVKLKFVWYLDVSGPVDSSVVIGLVNWLLGRIFGRGEREGEREKQNVTLRGFVFWQQIVLGWLDKWWEGKYGNCETFVGTFRTNVEGRQYKRLLFYITICNAVSTEISCGCLKDTNPVQTEHHNINKCYGCDQWQAFWTWHWTACLVTCTVLELLTHPNLHCTPCSTWTCSTDDMCLRFY
jgi:hypothetical protein